MDITYTDTHFIRNSEVYPKFVINPYMYTYNLNYTKRAWFVRVTSRR